MEAVKPRYEGKEHFESHKQIEQIKNQKWDCTIIIKADCGATWTTCCVNCSTFDECLVVCRHSERWVISNQTCIFATNNCKKTEKEGKEENVS